MLTSIFRSMVFLYFLILIAKRIIYTIYIVNQAKMLGKEHLKAPSPIYEHDNTTGHKTTVDNFKIIGREGHGISRTIQEAIYIRVNNPTLNRNVGKYNLPHIWDKVLFTIPELRIN